MPSPDFSKLSPEQHNLLELAKQKNGLDVLPLQELKGGQTGAFLYLASVSSAGDPRRVEHFVIKFDRVNPKAKPSEMERHRLAVSQAPSEFSKQNMPVLAYEFEHDGAVALFYTLAGQSLQRFRTLASNERQHRLEVLFAATNDFVLKKWNAEPTFERAMHPQKLLQTWLGYRLKPDGQIGSFLKDGFRIDPHTEGFLIQGEIFPNPLSYGLSVERWKQTRPIDVLTGFQHGDLNTGNILAKFAEDSNDLEGYFLIDFALYKDQMPLLYDQCYLEISYLIHELGRAPFEKWVSFVSYFSRRDLPNPKEVPVEMSGACAVITAGRKSFERWIHEAHPSLSDDLWGQFWLAAVAAGLNFCNKAGLSTEERLAGLIYSAVHLKRYCIQFGVSLPSDVRLLYDADKWKELASINTLTSALNSPKNNLPIQPTPFIGRQAELTAVKDLLTRDSQVRLVTLTGPGGTGKTRLALQTAQELLNHFPDGVYFIDLAPIREPEGVLAVIARTIGIRETSDRPLLEALKGYLRTQNMLLLLDNFEQVTAAAPRVGELLQDCPQLKLLVTSREALHLRGEHIRPVPPLSLPSADHRGSSVEQLTQYEAVRLFIERVQAVKPDFQVTNENAPAVAEICFRLDGLPLAIELAAARIKLFSPQALLERVGSRLQLLRGGARDLPLRQQTLRDTIDWSYDLLDADEQRLFALLSVFAGCTFHAVERVVSDVESLDGVQIDVLDGLDSLIDKSLIRQTDQGPGEPRLVMLETIREYAAERLEQSPEFSTVARRAHASYFATFMQNQWKQLTGEEREAALKEIEADLENVRTAWRYWVEEKDLEHLSKFVDSLWLLYDVRGWYHATVSLTNDLLDVLAVTPSTPELIEQEIILQTNLARALTATKGYTEEVEQAYARAVALCERAGDIPQLFPVLRGFAGFYILRMEFGKAQQLGERILKLAEHLNDDDMRVDAQTILGYNVAFQENPQMGIEYLEKAIALYDPGRPRVRRLGLGANPGVISLTVSALFLWMLGYPDQARTRAADSIKLAQKFNHPYSIAYALFHNGLLNLWLKNYETTEENGQKVLELAQEHGFHIWNAVGLSLHGAALVGLDSMEQGLAEIEQGMKSYRALKTPPVFWPLLLHLCADAYGTALKPAEGLSLLNAAIEAASQGAGNTMKSEFLSLRGELLLAISSQNAAEAEFLYQEAINNAQAVHAPWLELRAALKLSRLWQEQGKKEQAQKLLSDAYTKITEGFSTHDMLEASALLATLAE
ncbi:MAG TPA: AAA family ATPase [Anaerolineales bacterium]|nr:AAA family ATPase [Anaerolineales bacterium]